MKPLTKIEKFFKRKRELDDIHSHFPSMIDSSISTCGGSENACERIIKLIRNILPNLSSTEQKLRPQLRAFQRKIHSHESLLEETRPGGDFDMHPLNWVGQIGATLSRLRSESEELEKTLKTLNDCHASITKIEVRGLKFQELLAARLAELTSALEDFRKEEQVYNIQSRDRKHTRLA